MTDPKEIKAFAFDIDGVMTDGSIICNEQGELWRIYNAKDTFGLRMAMMNGYFLAAITGGKSPNIVARMEMSGMDGNDIYLDSTNKVRDLKDYCRRHNISTSEVMYFGDDIPDITALQEAGIGMCPADAVPEVRDAADIICPVGGGKGCVRYGIELVMKAQGKWDLDHFDVDGFEKRF